MDVDDDLDDPIVAQLPIRLSTARSPQIQLHQFPLLTRPLQVPPPAAAAGRRIRARHKPGVRRLEVHVPVDARPEVWSAERADALGAARVEDDHARNQALPEPKKRADEPPRLQDVRMLSEPVAQRGAYMLGIVRDGMSLIDCSPTYPPTHALIRPSAGQLHLHPISETHQLRPTLTYLDAFSRKAKRRGGGADSDSDDGPPPDPDEPPPPPIAPKKEKKPADVKEVQVATRRAEGGDKTGPGAMQGGLSAARSEMLMILRAEEDEAWVDLDWLDGEVGEVPSLCAVKCL
jgi:DNA-directed RNA polymerase-3 subunit RPC5